MIACACLDLFRGILSMTEMDNVKSPADAATNAGVFKGLTFKDGATTLWSIQIEDNLDDGGAPNPYHELVLRGEAGAGHRFIKAVDQTVITAFRLINDAGVDAVDFSPLRVIARDFVANNVQAAGGNSVAGAFSALAIRSETRLGDNTINTRTPKWDLKQGATGDLEMVSAAAGTPKVTIAAADALLTAPKVNK